MSLFRNRREIRIHDTQGLTTHRHTQASKRKWGCIHYLKQLSNYQRQGLVMRWCLPTAEQVDTGQASAPKYFLYKASVCLIQGCEFRKSLLYFSSQAWVHVTTLLPCLPHSFSLGFGIGDSILFLTIFIAQNRWSTWPAGLMSCLYHIFEHPLTKANKSYFSHYQSVISCQSPSIFTLP